jgi:Ser/Thr protein kinase RdoA (MazF antagonist)
MTDPSPVLCQFPIRAVAVHALGNHGGFSGARLWRVETEAGAFCLRAWPPLSSERLHGIHGLMRTATAAGLAFVPVVVGEPVEHEYRLWDLTTWLPGRADFRENPTPERIAAAGAALARLHRAWMPAEPYREPCPAVQRRLDVVKQWRKVRAAGWHPSFGRADDPVGRWAKRAWRLLDERVETVPRELGAWVEPPVPVQHCLCDVWHDHVLYVGDEVTGLVDFGSVKPDHVAVDLARMLGSLAGDDARLWDAGLAGYGRERPLTEADVRLARVLDRTGTLLGLANWLRWLYYERRTYDDPDRVAGRLAELVMRAEGRQQ